MSSREDKAVTRQADAMPESDGFGKPGGPLSPPVRQTNAAVSQEVNGLSPADPGQDRAQGPQELGGPNLERDVKQFTARLQRRYPDQIAADPKAFKKRARGLVGRNLPPFAGRPMEESINQAAELRKQEHEWKEIYPLVIPDHARLDAALRRQAESNLRAALRSRRNARRRRSRGKRYLVTASSQPSAAGASGAGG